jgi:hypothetical protein
MIRSVVGRRVPDNQTMAAVIAAVQAYLDEEASATRSRSSRRLSRWKTAPWQTFRGRDPWRAFP